MKKKKLTLSRNSMIGGVCGGIAEYFNIDPGLVRIVTALTAVFTGAPIGVIYLIAWFALETK